MIELQPNPLLKKLDLLYPLTGLEQAALNSAFSRIVRFGENEDIAFEGDRPSECNVLLEGMIIRYKLLPDGKRQIFIFHIPGDIYDSQSFLLDRMDHNLATITPCKIAVITHATMQKLTEDYPRIGRAFWKDTLVDAAVFREWTSNIGRRSAHQRIAHLICELFLKLQAVGLAEDHQIIWPITQNELGDALGLSLVHVNRTLQELRAKGLITLKSARLHVLDWEGLKEAGQFDPAYLHLKLTDPAASGNGHPPGGEP